MLLDYALLADGERGVLVGPRGDFAWMCMPHWDSDAVFSTLIGGGGIYAVTPQDAHFVWGGYYEDCSLIWRSRWVTSSSVIECREALAFPGDRETAVLLRRVRAVEGTASVSCVLDVRAAFGQEEMSNRHLHDGTWTGRSGEIYVRWNGAETAHARRDGGLEMEVNLEPGTHHDLVLELSVNDFPEAPKSADDYWSATEASWAQSLPNFDLTVAPRAASHSYAVLRGMTSATGGMVAAATMSLPERAEAGSNYDYRYAWIRDQCYVGQACAVTTPLPLLDDAVRFVSERIIADGSVMRPAYRVDGLAVPKEKRLKHLSGYPGGFDKVGNWVNGQFQLDAFGEALLLFAAAARHDRLDSIHWSAVETAVAAIDERWREPDAGIWELENRLWTQSRLMAIAGLRDIARCAPAAAASKWSGLADAMLSEVAASCVHVSGRWQRAVDDDKVDASLLIPTLRGGLAKDDPRGLATLAAIDRDLVRDGYVYRFRHDERPLEEAEGAFTFCGLLMSLALHQQGDAVEARAWFERNRAVAGPPGLLSEEFDIRQGQLRGNLPQSFVHALVLECAARLSEPWT
ncbi:MAG: glycoside hydrolase family 15 protein [Acidimicrobiales bacterium]